ncbi:DUF5688 family protein (plasmid) [Enterocloster clostridioformis]
MDITEFCEKAAKALQERLGTRYNVKVWIKEEPEGTLPIIQIENDCEGWFPPVLMEPCYHDFLEGKESEEWFENIISAICCGLFDNDCKMFFIHEKLLSDYEYAQNKIVFALFNGKNIISEEIPTVPYLDMKKAFYILSTEEADPHYHRFVYKSDLEKWRVSLDTIHEMAMVNTPKLLPAVCTDMADILEAEGEESDGAPFTVLGNNLGLYGAAVMLYPDILKSLSDKFEMDILILPLTIEEVLILPDEKMIPYYEWNKLIDQIKQMLPKKVVLMTHPYLYIRETGQIEIVGEEGRGGGKIV